VTATGKIKGRISNAASGKSTAFPDKGNSIDCQQQRRVPMSDVTFEATDDHFGGLIEIVSAYVSNSNNRLAPEELQTLIRETFATLSSLTVSGITSVEETEDFNKTKAEIKKSIGVDSLVSFIDGREYKSLKRHLTTNGYTPETYRSTFGLAADYPMTHPAYSARRSELAKSIGLGQKGRQAKETGKKPRASKAPAAE
jgi:predicted transcriptional regulator